MNHPLQSSLTSYLRRRPYNRPQSASNEKVVVSTELSTSENIISCVRAYGDLHRRLQRAIVGATKRLLDGGGVLVKSTTEAIQTV